MLFEYQGTPSVITIDEKNRTLGYRLSLDEQWLPYDQFDLIKNAKQVDEHYFFSHLLPEFQGRIERRRAREARLARKLPDESYNPRLKNSFIKYDSQDRPISSRDRRLHRTGLFFTIAAFAFWFTGLFYMAEALSRDLGDFVASIFYIVFLVSGFYVIQKVSEHFFGRIF